MNEKEIAKHPTKEWEISIIKLCGDRKREYKVIRRLKDQEIQETKIFESLEEAKKQFNEWMEA